MWGEKSPKSLKIRAVEVKIYLRPGFLPYFWWNISTIWPFVDKNPFWRCQMMGQSCFECFQKRKYIFSSKRRCWVGFFVFFSHFWVIGQITARSKSSSVLVFWSRSGWGCTMAFCTWRWNNIVPYFKIKAVGEQQPGKIKILRFLDISLPPPGKLI